MGRKNKHVAMRITEDDLPEDWEITRNAGPRIDVMPSRTHGLTGKDRIRAERRSRKQSDKAARFERELSDGGYI